MQASPAAAARPASAGSLLCLGFNDSARDRVRLQRVLSLFRPRVIAAANKTLAAAQRAALPYAYAEVDFGATRGLLSAVARDTVAVLLDYFWLPGVPCTVPPSLARPLRWIGSKPS
jgi:hypothetical protein